ncbi:phage holin family protein [Mycetohabitans sp. B5]|uniref:Putative phage holin n=1 Tax=Mycetohabitans endofungorum TaxID=417203 RepID=A0A2P5K7X0_9BURK|nr:MULTISPECIES: putative holin [Mycetohabitans]MCG1054269.1 phage holin family protein [Mycetohabitans sp. B5]PPB82818.1 putative phage holin [Mycetohabitans endofungorum]
MTWWFELLRVPSVFSSRAWTQDDLTLISGVVCGALIFLLHSREPSWPRKIAYFGVSVIGGFSVTSSVQQYVGLPEWLAAFLSTAAIVTLANTLLDWSEKIVPELLTQLTYRIIGSTPVNDTKNSELDK